MSVARRQLLVMAGFALVGWVLAWHVGLPLWTQWRQVKAEISAARSRLNDARQLAARHAAVEQACQAYPDAWSDDSEAVLQRVWMEELDAVARAAQLRVELVPKPTHVQGRRTQLNLEVAVEATQETFLGFLDKLLTSTSAIQLDRLQVVTAASSSAVRATLVLSKLVMATR